MKSIELKVAIQKALSNIGKKNGTAPLPSSSNSYATAHELFVASELRSAANKRYEKAKEAAASSGVIDETECVSGATITTHTNDYFDVQMKKASDSTTLDKTQLSNNLKKMHNLTDTQVEKLIAASSKPRKGAVTIEFALKG